MNINKAFPSKYLKASDLDDGPLTVKIKDVVIENIGQGQDMDEKVVIHFYNQKPMVANKTNCKTITNILGSSDTDEWIGKSITLICAEVEFGGETVPAIRVSKKLPGASAGKSAPKQSSEDDYADSEADAQAERESRA